jgi:glucose-1-phosphate cytidylyltransferase
MGADGIVNGLESVSASALRINGGYFIMRRDVVDEIGPTDDLIADVLPRLIARREVMAFQYDGFWAPMDNVRDRQVLEGHVARGSMPWAVWQPVAAPAPRLAPVPILDPATAR